MHPLVFIQPSQEDPEDFPSSTEMASAATPAESHAATNSTQYNLEIQELIQSGEHSKTFLVRCSSISQNTVDQ